MKKTLLLAAALACSGAVAQEKEVWACQMEQGVQLAWEDEKWIPRGVTPTNILFSINTDNTAQAKWGEDSEPDNLKCEKEIWLSCKSFAMIDSYLFDSKTGKLGASKLLGAVLTDKDYRDSIVTLQLNCLKF